ncbi:hypothetical protein K2173_016716 [Erythroxylum novogranatense]|uniref:Uncharacterized protein n=1 Tax=Erythroxylum novogranatense TaxID=1862640 RepID=A0AAV8SHF9_9ROSI|nr:hypothetical protein K2173_016716 [Erythroxylum novogranatense]
MYFIHLQKGTKTDVATLLEEELHSARSAFEQARFNLVTALSNVEAKKRFEFLEAVSGTMDARLRYFKQLVLRLNRLEDILLRFEENMLKPINSIDERLQCVERQLEVLSKKAQNVELLSCTRISAPEFSCSESETNSFYNSGSLCQLFAILVVTAPAFSNCDDEEENEEVEQVTEPQRINTHNEEVAALLSYTCIKFYEVDLDILNFIK